MMPSLEATGPRNKEKSLLVGGEPENQPQKEEQTVVFVR